MPTSNIECMFDTLVGGSDAELIDAMGVASRAESVAIARRLAAVGELYARRSVQWAERALWCADPFDEVAAEVSAAQNVSRGRAGTQIRYALALRECLPRVAAVFAAGDIDFRMVTTIINRTSTVDAALIAKLDAALAAVVARWMKLSGPKLIDRIDQWVAKFDADGVRVPPAPDEGRFVEVTPIAPGLAGIYAHVHAADAAAFDQRLDALAATVCTRDPRTVAQRRSEAVGAMAAGADRLACLCGSEACPMAGPVVAAPVCDPSAGRAVHPRGCLEQPGVSAGVRRPARGSGAGSGRDRDGHAGGHPGRAGRGGVSALGGSGGIHRLA